MPPLLRLVKLAAGAMVALLYVWFAAVRALPEAKRRKAAKRAALRYRGR